MCFEERIGYTCGHASPCVLRTCPQVTADPRNPVCQWPAQRPLLAQTFCGQCARVSHNRWWDIVEQEHRWMHERGACGCPVYFPDLLQPRMIGRGSSSGIMSDSDLEESGRPRSHNSNMSSSGDGVDGFGSGSLTMHSSLHGWDEKHADHYHDDGVAAAVDRAQKQKEQYPAFKRIQSRAGEPDSYLVRLSSLYGVEWAWEHEKLHQEGQCPCHVRFDKYKPQVDPPKQEQDVTATSREENGVDDDTASAAAASPAEQEGDHQDDASAAASGTTDMEDDAAIPPPLSSPNPAFPARWSCNPPPLGGYYSSAAQGVILPGMLPLFPTTTSGLSTATTITTPTTTTFTGETAAYGTAATSVTGGSSVAGGSDYGAFGSYSSRPVDMPTAWFPPPETTAKTDATPVLGLPLGLGPEGTSGTAQQQREGYMVQYEQPTAAAIDGEKAEATTPPLSGFPIGAGPEGSTHAGPFEECELYDQGQNIRRCSSTSF